MRTYNVRVRLANSVAVAQVEAASKLVAQLKVEEEIVRQQQFGVVIRVDVAS